MSSTNTAETTVKTLAPVSVKTKVKGQAPEKKEKVKGPTYPFPTQKSIRAVLAADLKMAAIACEILATMNKFTASDKRAGTAIAGLLETLTEKDGVERLAPEDQAWLLKRMPAYSAQVCRHLIRDMIEKDPSLEELAKLFSVKF